MSTTMFGLVLFIGHCLKLDCDRPDAAGERPNVVFILADDQNIHELPMFRGLVPLAAAQQDAGIQEEDYWAGQNITFKAPNIEKLGKDGLIFTNMHVATPACTPSRFAALTGRYSSRAATVRYEMDAATATPLVSWDSFVAYEKVSFPSTTGEVSGLELTSAALLQAQGYTTGFVGKWHLTPPWEDYPEMKRFKKSAGGLEYGSWAEWTAGDKQQFLNFSQYKRALIKTAGFNYSEAVYFANPEDVDHLGIGVHNQEWVTNAALAFIDSAVGRPSAAGTTPCPPPRKAAPFYLHMCPTLPHAPGMDKGICADPRITQQEYLPDDAPELTGELQPSRSTVLARSNENCESLMYKGEEPPAHGLWLDDAVGAVVGKLAALGVENNTLVIYMPDHQRRGKGTAYEATHVAMVMKWPGTISPGQVVAAPLRAVDLVPTLLEAAGVTASALLQHDFNGESVLSLILAGTNDRASGGGRGGNDDNDDEGNDDDGEGGGGGGGGGGGRVVQGWGALASRELYTEVGYTRAILHPSGWKIIASSFTKTADFDTHGIVCTTGKTKYTWQQEDHFVGTSRCVDQDGGAAKLSSFAKWEDQWALRAVKYFPYYYDVEQLYHLPTDPLEQTNLATMCPEQLACLQQSLRLHMQEQLPATFGVYTADEETWTATFNDGFCAGGGGSRSGLNSSAVLSDPTQCSAYVAPTTTPAPVLVCRDYDGEWSGGVDGNEVRTCHSYIGGSQGGVVSKVCSLGVSTYNQFGWGGHFCSTNGMGGEKCCAKSCRNCPPGSIPDGNMTTMATATTVSSGGGGGGTAASTTTAAAASATTTTTAPPTALGDAKQVLFVMMDDLRMQIGARRIPGTHEMHTPNIDAFMNRSIFFPRAACQIALCAPSRASLMTSRRPDTNKVWDLHTYWRDVGGNFSTLPQFLQTRGFNAHGVGKIFHPGGSAGQTPGPSGRPNDDMLLSWNSYYHAPNFEIYEGKGPSADIEFLANNCPSCGNSWAAVPSRVEATYPLPDTQLADEAIRYINASWTPRQRNFLAVGFRKPHLPFVFPEKYLDLYPADTIALPENQSPPVGMANAAWSSSGELKAWPDIKAIANWTGHADGEPLPPASVKALRRAYYACVSFADFEFGRVMDAVEQSESGMAHTVVTFVGDHGYQLGEMGEWAKHTNFDMAINTPMIVHLPGMVRGDGFWASNEYAELVDMFPTIVEAALGEAVPVCPANSTGIILCTEGVSLVPVFAAHQAGVDGGGSISGGIVKPMSFSQYSRKECDRYPHEPSRQALGQCWAKDTELRQSPAALAFHPMASACLSRNCTMGYSVLTVVKGSEVRYTEWIGFDPVDGGVFGAQYREVELYNHSTDSGLENTNVISGAPADLVADLHNIIVEYAASFSGVPPPAPTSITTGTTALPSTTTLYVGTCMDYDGVWGQPTSSRTCDNYVKPNKEKFCASDASVIAWQNQFGWGGHFCQLNGMGGEKCCPLTCDQCPPGSATPNAPGATTATATATATAITSASATGSVSASTTTTNTAIATKTPATTPASTGTTTTAAAATATSEKTTGPNVPADSTASTNASSTRTTTAASSGDGSDNDDTVPPADDDDDSGGGGSKDKSHTLSDAALVAGTTVFGFVAIAAIIAVVKRLQHQKGRAHTQMQQEFTDGIEGMSMNGNEFVNPAFGADENDGDGDADSHPVDGGDPNPPATGISTASSGLGANPRAHQQFPNDLQSVNATTVPNGMFSASAAEYFDPQLTLGRNAVVLGKLIGEGNFGKVYLGTAKDPRRGGGAKIEVAVKSPSADARLEFEAEMEIMGQLTRLGGHPNIVSVVGCVYGEEPLLVLEFCSGGSLKSALTAARTGKSLPSTVVLATYAHQVALAMKFLEDNRLLHRDLAARNILLTAENDCKLSDFGLSRIVDGAGSADYYRRNGASAPIPVRWMAPETLDDNLSTIMSDRWSFGVLLWEIYSIAIRPYAGMANHEIAGHIRAGRRLEQPQLCPNSVYALMLRCWSATPADRPVFSNLAVHLHGEALGARVPAAAGGVTPADVSDFGNSSSA